MAEQKEKSKTKPKPKEVDDLSKEIDELGVIINELHEDIKKMTPKSAWKRAGLNLLTGITKGVGLIIGTTIIAGIIFLVLQRVLNSPTVQTWIGETLQESIQSYIEVPAPDNTTNR